MYYPLVASKVYMCRKKPTLFNSIKLTIKGIYQTNICFLMYCPLLAVDTQKWHHKNIGIRFREWMRNLYPKPPTDEIWKDRLSTPLSLPCTTMSVLWSKVKEPSWSFYHIFRCTYFLITFPYLPYYIFCII